MKDGYTMRRRHSWTLKEQAEFLKRTGELLSRGYPLSEAIQSLTYQMKRKQQEEILQSLQSLKEGYPFYKILNDLFFHQTLVGFVFFAEKHGSLTEAFLEGSEMMLKREHDATKLKKLLLYPTILLLMTLFLFLFVDHILLPQYSYLFSSMSLTPNIFMQFIQFIGEFFPYIVVGMISLLFLLFLFYVLKLRKQSPLEKSGFLTSIPFIGSFFRLYMTHYFSIQLSYLLKGGLSILDALKHFEKHEKNAFDRQLGEEMKLKLSEGDTFDKIVRAYPFFERDLSFITRHGQENGKLEQELYFYSKYCLQKLEEKTEKLFKVVQPILYSVIGIIIVSIYLAILLPMFQLMNGL